MNRKQLMLISMVSAVAVLAFVMVSGIALAQKPAPPGTAADGVVNTVAVGAPSAGDAGSNVNIPAPSTGSGGDGGQPSGQAPDLGPHPAWADEAEAPAISFSYFRYVGTAFNPRTTTTTYAYNFNGCVYETGGTDNRFMAPLLLPEGSTIKFLRLYYDDTNAGSDLTAWLTRYQPGVTSEDLTSVNSSGSSGYGTTLSNEITHTVDLTSWAYTIIIAPNANASSNTFCGVRVAYYAPIGTTVLLPGVLHNATP